MNILGSLHAKNPLAGSSTPAETTQDSRVDDYRILSLERGKTLGETQPRQRHRGGGRIALTVCNQRDFLFYIYACTGSTQIGHISRLQNPVQAAGDTQECQITEESAQNCKIPERAEDGGTRNLHGGGSELSDGSMGNVSERH